MSLNKKRKIGNGWLPPLLGGLGVGLATYLGQPQLAVPAYNLGHSLGSRFRDITGYGAYTVRRNSFAGGVPSVGNPSFIENGLVISHKEYLGDVLTAHTPNTFTSNSFRINPGQSQTWEWLAQIACNYEQWVPQGIVFMFKSTSGDSLTSTNTALGCVMMATQYDLYSKPFANKAEMMSYEYCSSGIPSGDIVHFVECDPSQTPVTTLDIDMNSTSPGDRRFADLGTFTIATSGFQGTDVVIGELWVTYQVCLLKPKLYSSLGKFNDYLQMSGDFTGAYQNTSLPYGSFLDSRLVFDPATSIPIYPYSTGSLVSVDGTTYGNPDLPGLSIIQEVGIYPGGPAVANSGRVTLVFPVYAFPTVYFIRSFSMSANVDDTPDPLVYCQSDFGNVPVSFGVVANCNDSDVDKGHIVSFYVYVPGQKLIPRPTTLITPRVSWWSNFGPWQGWLQKFTFAITQFNSDVTRNQINYTG